MEQLSPVLEMMAAGLWFLLLPVSQTQFPAVPVALWQVGNAALSHPFCSLCADRAHNVLGAGEVKQLG